MSFNRKHSLALSAVTLLFIAGCGTDEDTLVQKSTATKEVAHDRDDAVDHARGNHRTRRATRAGSHV